MLPVRQLTQSSYFHRTDPFPSHPTFARGMISGDVELAPMEQSMKPDQSNQFELPRERIPPEILEWARQTFDEEDFLTQVREIEAMGGLQLEDFIADLEARARSK
jgi:hypothetical protein